MLTALEFVPAFETYVLYEIGSSESSKFELYEYLRVLCLTRTHCFVPPTGVHHCESAQSRVGHQLSLLTDCAALSQTTISTQSHRIEGPSTAQNDKVQGEEEEG